MLRLSMCALLCITAACAAHTRVKHFLIHEASGGCSAYTAAITERTPYRYKDRLYLTLSPVEESNRSIHAVSWVPKQSPLHEGDKIAVAAAPDMLEYQNYQDTLRQGITHSIRLTESNWSYITQTPVLCAQTSETHWWISTQDSTGNTRDLSMR